ncbi:M23 family metallopeptidase [Oryzibacter oryziterrae]|uniref:M23 family metallopeptidase n=1 Tax=Oryzibacter oryziterrae TaxID=2766474 RepID=UPI001F1989B3|nr:M23 family metallopeptidase [Oryzibacter oryziterrae]
MSRVRAEDRYYRPKSSRRIVIISGDNTRTYTISPVLLICGVVLGLGLSVSLLAASSYLIFRDDLFDIVHARNASMQQAYEDRIARLRSEIDKMSSRQILDQVAMDDKIEHLMSAQQSIADRQRAVASLIDKASGMGLIDGKAAGSADQRAEATPTPSPASAYAEDGRASLIDQQFDALRATDGASSARGLTVPGKQAAAAPLIGADGHPDFKALAIQLAAVDREQAQTVAAIATAANQRAEQAVNVINNLGVSVTLPKGSEDEDESAVGGPFIPMGSAEALNSAIADAGAAFDRLRRVKSAAAAMPLTRPLPNAEMTSNFGSRRDPFLGSLAFHAGIDFRSPVGTNVRPTAAGVVTNASWAGGYGNMVEVDHGNGITTRYGHLSKILVQVGDRVTTDSIIGEVGSTGRSTGPHLHYETRVNGTAINPVNYINAGIKLAAILP